jgi:hypothetical protein
VTYEIPDPVATRKIPGPFLGDWIGGPLQGYRVASRDYWTASVSAGAFTSTAHETRGGALLALETVLGHHHAGTADGDGGTAYAELTSRPVPGAVLAALRAAQVPAEATHVTVLGTGRPDVTVYVTREGARTADRSASVTVDLSQARRAAGRA